MEYFVENKTLKREFRIQQDHLISGPVENKLSGDIFVPDGNGSEFTIRFVDGDEISSKSACLVDIKQENGGTIFTFEEKYNTVVKVAFQSSADGTYIKKRVMVSQTQEKPIDYALLENVGIINSTNHFTVPVEQDDAFYDGYYATLGQPFYVNSFFYGCEFPATSNKIKHAIGYVKYYLGKSVEPGKVFKFPVTILGAAESKDMAVIKSAFEKYIDSISTENNYRIQYNSWYDHMLDINEQNVKKSFYEIEKGLTTHGVPTIDAYVIDDGWNDYRSDFWSFNRKFADGLYDYTKISSSLGSHFGLWLGPRGGYNYQNTFAKRIEKSGNGYYNKESNDICVGSEKYINKLQEFFISNANDYDIDYWKLDGFCLKPCKNSSHDHITGGYKEMYYITEMWSRWINVFKKMRKERPQTYINMTCYVNPSPWWLQYVNSIWLQNSTDIGFEKNIQNQRQVESEITYRDSRYYDFLYNRALQFPQSRIYNHEPIYGNTAKVDYTDQEFEKFLFSNAIRGQAFNELYLSYNMMNEEKWKSLAKVLEWSKENYHIIKNSHFLGGDPAKNNVYMYSAWTENGEGIVALRNPSDSPAEITVTLNKLMGVPETLTDVKRYNVYDESSIDSEKLYSYNQKMEISLLPFEFKLYQFGKEDKRYKDMEEINDFTISFTCNESNETICENKDISVKTKDGKIVFKVDNAEVVSDSSKTEDTVIHLVREKNASIKIYINGVLDNTSYSKNCKQIVDTQFDNDNIEFIDRAMTYDEIPAAEKKSTKKWFKF